MKKQNENLKKIIQEYKYRHIDVNILTVFVVTIHLYR